MAHGEGGCRQVVVATVLRVAPVRLSWWLMMVKLGELIEMDVVVIRVSGFVNEECFVRCGRFVGGQNGDFFLWLVID